MAAGKGVPSEHWGGEWGEQFIRASPLVQSPERPGPRGKRARAWRRALGAELAAAAALYASGYALLGNTLLRLPDLSPFGLAATLAFLTGSVLVCRLLRRLASPVADGDPEMEQAARLCFTGAMGLALSPFLWLFLHFR